MTIFECSRCGKKLRRRSGIIRHLRKCGDEKKIADPLKNRYPCAHCHKEFFSHWGLSKHKKKNHSIGIQIQKEVTKSLKCNYCSAMFASRLGRIKHAKKNHPEYNIKMDELSTRKTHDCIFCGKPFTSKTYRYQHEDICMKKFEAVASSSDNSPDQRAEEILTSDEIFFLQQDILASNNIPTDQNALAEINPMPLEVELHDTNFPLDLDLMVPESSNNVDESQSSSSSDEIKITPKLKRYIRDRKSFLKLRTPDMNSPRRSRLNLDYGQQTVTECQKKINALQQQVRGLQKQVKTFKDLLHHLKKQNKISTTAADELLKCIEETVEIVYVY